MYLVKPECDALQITFWAKLCILSFNTMNKTKFWKLIIYEINLRCVRVCACSQAYRKASVTSRTILKQKPVISLFVFQNQEPSCCIMTWRYDEKYHITIDWSAFLPNTIDPLILQQTPSVKEVRLKRNTTYFNGIKKKTRAGRFEKEVISRYFQKEFDVYENVLVDMTTRYWYRDKWCDDALFRDILEIF